ncbi:hypothetical protein BD410DRAFT_716867 [Rickenella mellea]|uniref:Uncharacterized protein n=1 Tax=Rickenella mellea TaxID=50990 RepID=A0A4Y7QGW8_9AGAM|nr:hypothetical protein BD410DRAFT_716867 [Rickenella mellea]
MSLEATASSPPAKKRKHLDDSGDALKRVKKDKEGKPEKKDKTKKKDKKGKGRAEESANGEFQLVTASVSVSIPPIFAGNPMAGVEEMLDSLVMRYVPALQGVLLSHSNIRFLTRTAMIKGDCPFANCDVGFDATVWSPRVGMKLNGKINLCSPDHISLLVHKTFNVSIPRHHIPTENWEFEYGPAENDPEFGAGAGGEEASTRSEIDALPDADSMNVDGGDSSEGVEEGGTWIHKVTGDKLGGAEGELEFTVVGYTIANQMLSLVGSIQLDPFSPEHVARPAVLSSVKERAVVDVMDETHGSEEDVFAALGRLEDEEE